jgi:hypothetical protein
MNSIWDKFWYGYKDSIANYTDVRTTISSDRYYYLLRFLLKKGKVFENCKDKSITLAEIGSGIGLRSVALLVEFPTVFKRIVLFDHSEIALSLAENLRKQLPGELREKVHCIQGDLFICNDVLICALQLVKPCISKHSCTKYAQLFMSFHIVYLFQKKALTLYAMKEYWSILRVQKDKLPFCRCID